MDENFFKSQFIYTDYVNKYKDLQEANINTNKKAWRHALRHGHKENRDIFSGDMDLLNNFKHFRTTGEITPIPDKYKEKIKKMKISICMCVKDSGDYIKYMKKTYTELENIYNNSIIFEYFIYENNSKDNTKQNLIDFKNTVKGNCNLIMEDLPPPPKFGAVSLKRGEFVRNLRNNFKDRIGKLDSDYVFFIDDDVYFKIDFISELISKMKGKIKMVVSNGITMNIFLGKNCYHHYDTLAFISLDGISHKDTSNTCLNKNCIRCIEKRKKMNNILNKKYLIDMNKNDIIEIKSGFGSCSLIETNMWNKINFTNDKEEIQELEWPSLCRNIRDNGGKVVLSCKSKALIANPQWNYKHHVDLIIDTLDKL